MKLILIAILITLFIFIIYKLIKLFIANHRSRNNIRKSDGLIKSFL